MTFDFSNQRVLISGGTSGIGFAIAVAFAESGAQVTATGLTEAEVTAAAQRTSRVRFRALNVRDSNAVKQLVTDLDTLQVLINCAGMLHRNGAEFDEATFAEVVDTNLSGTMRLCLACRSLLAKAGGCVVNTASMLSFFGSGSVPAYSASKGGVAQLTKSLAIAWAADGIRVNAVAPGWIETPLTRPLVEDATRRQEILNRTPMRRWGRPEDIAGPVLFLCSPAAAFMTGVVLPVDGGYSIA
jgi:NAD(P)-dependent dehydrogenase (short-subunit alcohol dehydrogenase family)